MSLDIIYYKEYSIKQIEIEIILIKFLKLGIGDWGWGFGDWGLGPIPNPQSPIPNPQSPSPIFFNFYKLKGLV